MSDARIAIGILGCGGYGRTARRYLNHTGQFDIVACLDSMADAAEAAGAEESSAAYTDMDAFLSHPGMQAVCINTPVLVHAEHSLRCLDAGKHVFITKPVTAFVDEAERILALAEELALAFVVGHHARHSASNRLVAKLLDEGRLGRVCNVLVTSCSSAGLEQGEGDWRVEAGKNPGGPLLQCGIHTIDVLLGWFGPAREVRAMIQDDVTPFDVVDNTFTLIEFAGGVQASIVCNYTTAYLHTKTLFGTEGNLHVCAHVTGLGEEQVYFQPRGRGGHEPWRALALPQDRSYPDEHGGVLEKEFARQVRTGQPSYENLHDAIDALRVVHAAVASAETGRSVALGCTAD